MAYLNRFAIALILYVPLVLGQFEEYLVIANGSVPCELYYPTMMMLGQKEPYRLTDADKMRMFRSLGGQIVSSMQAVTEQEAKDNFRNLLPITNQEQAILRKYFETGDLNVKENMRLALVAFYKDKSEGPAQVKPSVANLVKPKEEMSFSVPKETVRYGPIQEGTVCERTDFCMNRGEHLAYPYNEYRRLCTVCSVTREMTQSYWPRYINQAKCQDPEPVCMVNADNKPQGVCHNTHITMSMLRRQDGMCILALSNGQMVVAEDWEIAHDITNAGCECAVHEKSELAPYV